MPPKVSIVILQFNNSEDTIKCLQFVKDLRWQNLEIIVVDNASNPPHSENTENYLKSQKVSSFKFYFSSENLGYAGGNNIGIKKALENAADYVLILNNDTEVPTDLLEKLINTAQEIKTDLIGPAIKENGKFFCGGKIQWLRPELTHIACGKEQRAKSNDNLPFAICHSQYIPGSCMLISRKTIEKIGLLPEEYFLYFEDADYGLKAHKMGLKCVITPETAINHREHGSTAKIGSPLILRYHFRNSLYFNRKNGPFWAKILVYPWSLWVIGKQLLKLALDIHREQSRAILAGVSDFYRERMGKINAHRNRVS